MIDSASTAGQGARLHHPGRRLINNHDFSDEFVREAWRQSEDRDNQGEFYERLLEDIE